MASNTIDVDALREQFPGFTHHSVQPRWDVAKVVIRSISVFLAAVACVELITLSFAPSSGAGRYSMGAVFLILSIAWNAVELIVICARHDKSKGIRASAHVGCDLVLWIGGLAETILVAVLLGQERSYGHVVGDDYMRHWRPLVQSFIAIMGVLSGAHFALFVRACIELDRQKKDVRVQQLISALQKRDGSDNGSSAFPLSTFSPPPTASSANSPRSEFHHHHHHHLHQQKYIAELPTIEPAELHGETAPTREMQGSTVFARELPAPGGMSEVGWAADPKVLVHPKAFS